MDGALSCCEGPWSTALPGLAQLAFPSPSRTTGPGEPMRGYAARLKDPCGGRRSPESGLNAGYAGLNTTSPFLNAGYAGLNTTSPFLKAGDAGLNITSPLPFHR